MGPTLSSIWRLIIYYFASFIGLSKLFSLHTCFDMFVSMASPLIISFRCSFKRTLIKVGWFKFCIFSKSTVVNIHNSYSCPPLYYVWLGRFFFSRKGQLLLSIDLVLYGPRIFWQRGEKNLVFVRSFFSTILSLISEIYLRTRCQSVDHVCCRYVSRLPLAILARCCRRRTIHIFFSGYKLEPESRSRYVRPKNGWTSG